MSPLPVGKPANDTPFIQLCTMNLSAALTHYSAQLAAHAVDAPKLSAEVLLAFAWGIERNDLIKRKILAPHQEIPTPVLHAFSVLCERRSTGEPVAYLTGIKEFYGLDFHVNRHTLIPRPETELLVETALDFAQSPPSAAKGSADRTTNTPRFFADICTGSGCVALAFALNSPGWMGLAVDLVSETLATAQKNACKHKVHTITFIQADLNTLPIRRKSLDLLTANPPYVSTTEYRECSNEVRCFEPREALVPTTDTALDGLHDLCAIIRQAPLFLKPQGAIMLEMGYKQGPSIQRELENNGFINVRVLQDAAHHDRIAVGNMP